MVQSVIQLSIAPKLLVSPQEAADMCGVRGAKKFLGICPVPLVDIDDGRKHYAVRDLESWIESKKNSGSQAKSDDQLLAELV